MTRHATHERKITAPAGDYDDRAALASYRAEMHKGDQALVTAHLIHGHWIHSPKALADAFEFAGAPMLSMDAMPVGAVARRLVERLSR